MKYSVSIVLVLVFSLELAFSQVADTTLQVSQQNEYNQYMMKSKKQKKAGLILLAAGAPSVAALFKTTSKFDQIY